MKRSPHPRERFFEQAVLNQDLGQGLLELAGLGLELLDLVGGRLTGAFRALHTAQRGCDILAVVALVPVAEHVELHAENAP